MVEIEIYFFNSQSQSLSPCLRGGKKTTLINKLSLEMTKSLREGKKTNPNK